MDIGEYVREAEVTAKGLPRQRKNKKGKGRATQASGPPKTNTKEETKARKQAAQAKGSMRGTRDGQNDNIFVKQQPIIDAESMHEGLYALVQTGLCRRKVLTEIYGNKPASEFKILNYRTTRLTDVLQVQRYLVVTFAIQACLIKLGLVSLQWLLVKQRSNEVKHLHIHRRN